MSNKSYLGNEHNSFLKDKLKEIKIINIIIIGYKLYIFYLEDFKYNQIEVNDIEL